MASFIQGDPFASVNTQSGFVMDDRYHFIYALTLYMVVIISLAGCKQEEGPFGQETEFNLDLVFEETLTIREKALSDNDFLMLPVSVIREDGKGQIRTDDQGNIYMPDHSAVTIRVFDENGNYLYNIGRQGNGPGEFSSISALDLFGDELSVFDRGNNRIVQFLTSGEPLRTIVADGNQMIPPVSMHRFSDELYLFLHKTSSHIPAEYGEQVRQSSFFHLFDTRFSRPRHSFGQVDTIIDAYSAITDLYISGMNTGRVWMEDNALWFVPGVYSGRIFKYVNTDGAWKKAGLFEGKLLSDKTVEEGSDEAGEIAIVIYAPRFESFTGKVFSTSLGIFRLNDGRVMHVSSQYYEGDRQTIVEVFNEQGELEGLGRLDEFTFDGNDQGPGIGPFWKDQNDRFYFLDDTDDIPVLRGGIIGGI
jgi:hypothetical protein